MRGIVALIICLFVFTLAMGQKLELPGIPCPAIYSDQIVIDKKGNQIVPSNVLTRLEFSENLAPIRVIDATSNFTKAGFVDTKGKMIIAPSFDYIFSSF